MRLGAYKWCHVIAACGPHRRPLGRAVPHVHDLSLPLGDVAADGVPPKSGATMVEYDVATFEYPFATVASYVDCVRALTWGAMSATFWVFLGLKVCSF